MPCPFHCRNVKSHSGTKTFLSSNSLYGYGGLLKATIMLSTIGRRDRYRPLDCRRAEELECRNSKRYLVGILDWSRLIY